MLPNGRLLIFDNGRYRGWSRVVEIDPITMKIEWEYKADGFFTLSQGYAQRLGNGNTLITEAEKGHVFEIDKDGKKVWEFYHPDRQDKDNSPDHPESWGSRQWIYRAVRYSERVIDDS
jgi:outer membrane protein assembly factor BamB